MVTFAHIERARSRIADAIYTSPCARSQTFSQLCGCKTYFKLENLQMTGSFKERGALNCLLTLSPEARAAGVITASAGNHAQGLAFHAQRLGIRATVVMPETTPLIKVSSTRGYGARVVIHGLGYDDAAAEARRLCDAEGLTYAHPFDDEEVVAGQGTIGLELLEQNPYLEVVVVPVGGGGLISGIAIALKETNPKIRVYGVQSAGIAAVRASLAAGQALTVEPAFTIADGIAVKTPGAVTLPIIQKYVDDVVTVNEGEIANAILLLLEREKTLVEGAGAVPLAAVLNGHVPNVEGRKVGMVLSGGNIDVNVLSRILSRGLAKDGRLVRLRVKLFDRPGALAQLTTAVARAQANILETHHDRTFADTLIGETQVELVLETRGHAHVDEIRGKLGAAGYVVSVDSHPWLGA